MEKRKLSELYLCTTFFCIYVILIHLTAGPTGGLIKGSFPQMVFFIFNKSLSFVVPGFVFLSGLKLSYSYRNKEFKFIEFFQKRFQKILIPYFIWYIIYYNYFINHGFMANKTLVQHVFSFLMGTMVSPFYFITIIFQFYILFAIIITLFKKLNHKKIIIALFILNLIYLRFVFFKYEDRFFFTYLIYFAIGCYAAFHIDSFRNFINQYYIFLFLLFAAISIFYLSNTYYAFINGTPMFYPRIISCFFSILAILVYYGISYWLCNRFPNFLITIFKSIDGASYNIFLSHSFIIYICNDKWYQWGKASLTDRFLFTSLVLFPIVFSICILYQLLKNKLFKVTYIAVDKMQNKQ